ncbi:MAG: tetratricopeptide repeat protein, partial [Deltaproteobacteria bacterium]|nr:tetratricopeptide repeat protein [Deltaproteobacteria bacterium]
MLKIFEQKIKYNTFAQKGVFLMSARYPAYITFIFILMVYYAATINRNTAWKDDIALWQDVAVKSPGNPRGHNNLGNAYKGDGRIEDALREYKTALKLNPYLADARNNLGVIYKEKSLLDEAIAEYREALRHTHFPDHLKAIHRNLGGALGRKGFLDEAAREYEEAVRLDPHDGDSYYNLGVLYSQKGLWDKAANAFSEALKIKPDDTEAQEGLQKALLLRQFRRGTHSGL